MSELGWRFQEVLTEDQHEADGHAHKEDGEPRLAREEGDKRQVRQQRNCSVRSRSAICRRHRVGKCNERDLARLEAERSKYERSTYERRSDVCAP